MTSKYSGFKAITKQPSVLMLLNAIIWLPTLFTYLVFLLILMILFFIVAYVSHKIYISIYDNIPLPAAPGSRSMLGLREFPRTEHFGIQSSVRSVWIANRSDTFTTAVVRITLTLEPCYLISVELNYFAKSSQRAISFMCNCQHNAMECAAMRDPLETAKCASLLKFYDHLNSVPRLKVMLRCNDRSNMRLVLHDVINDVKVAHCNDASASCQAPNRRHPSDSKDKLN